jgi:hypothetical protein
MENNQQESILSGSQKSRKRYVRSLEYELIANLALQQYTSGEEILFRPLLGIPVSERIPALVGEYGLKRMHRLVKLVLNEFQLSLAVPKSRKLTETRTSVVACDLILAAEEDQLSLEDLIVFFEKARAGRYGKIKGTLTHVGIMRMLEQYREERFQNYVKLKEERELEMKRKGPQERTSPQPTAIKHLFDDGVVPLRKIS